MKNPVKVFAKQRSFDSMISIYSRFH